MSTEKTFIEIRTPRRADKIALRKLFLTSRKNTFTWADVNRFKLSDYDSETNGEKVIAAYDGLHLAGFISIYVGDNFIHHLYVEEECQKRGIGSALLIAAASVTGYPLRLKCLQKNIKALAYYKSKGFFETGTGVSEMGVYIDLEKTSA